MASVRLGERCEAGWAVRGEVGGRLCGRRQVSQLCERSDSAVHSAHAAALRKLVAVRTTTTPSFGMLGCYDVKLAPLGAGIPAPHCVGRLSSRNRDACD